MQTLARLLMILVLFNGMQQAQAELTTENSTLYMIAGRLMAVKHTTRYWFALNQGECYCLS